MKKLLVTLLSLMAVGAFIFAQDAAKPTVTVDGRVETGIKVNADKQTAVLYDDDSGDPSRVRLDAKATLGDFEAGVYVRDENLAYNATKGTGLGYAASNYWVGYHFLADAIVLRAGVTDASTFTTVNAGWGDGINTNGGVQVIVTPVKGLSFGAASGNLTNTAATLGSSLEKVAVGASYSIENVGALSLNYTSKNKLFTAGFNYTGVPGLTAQLEGYYQKDAGYDLDGDGTNDFVNSYDVELFQNFAYVIDSLTPSVALYEGFTKETLLDQAGSAFKINPALDYKVSPVVNLGAGVTAVYDKDNKLWKTKDITSPDGNDISFSAKPYVQFNFNSLASFVKIWYDTGDLKNTGSSDGTLVLQFRAFF